MKVAIKANTPTIIKCINSNLKKVAETHVRLMTQLNEVIVAHEYIDEIRQKAWHDGVPKSNEDFNTPLINLEEEADFLIQVAQAIKDYSSSLRSIDPENW